MDVPLTGSTDGEHSRFCSEKCMGNQECQYWFINPDAAQCALGTGFTGFEASTTIYSSFKHFETAASECRFLGTPVCMHSQTLVLEKKSRHTTTTSITTTLSHIHIDRHRHRQHQSYNTYIVTPLPYTNAYAVQAEIVGEELESVVAAGDTDEERDALCCRECSKLSECEFWVWDTGSLRCTPHFACLSECVSRVLPECIALSSSALVSNLSPTVLTHSFSACTIFL